MGEAFERSLKEFSELRKFAGAPKDFWNRFLAASAQIASADAMVLLLGNPGKTPRWSKIGEWTAGTGQPRLRAAFFSAIEAKAEQCLRDGNFVSQVDETGTFTVAIRLDLTGATEEVLLIGQMTDFTETAAQESFLRLSLGADTPALFQTNLNARQARVDVEKFATVLDWMVPINAEKHFLAAAMALCNGVASSLRCDRVSLGWVDAGYIKLETISRTESFDRKMVAAQGLEIAMEECLDQDEEIVWPSPEGATAVNRDHEKFAKDLSVEHLCSVPLRVGDKSVAVLTCERQASAFSPTEMQQLRLCCDQVVRRLDDLKRNERWFGARWTAAICENSSKLLGPEHTLAKLTAVLIAVLLAVLFFMKVNYRVEGNFILRSDEVAYLTAPFDGYIEKVAVRAGDHLSKGGELMSLNRGELFLEESSALAELSRHLRESEKARASKALAEMRISDAQAQQAQARLDLVRYRLACALIVSPFEGVVVDGDLRERIGAPVKQGDALYKVARTDTLYAEAEVNERDVKEILNSKTAEVAFVTQPKLTYPGSIVMVEPAATPKKDNNLFLVRLKFDRGTESWWRPGMTGVCKIAVEKRTLFWILTHRTVDFLRLYLWW